MRIGLVFDCSTLLYYCAEFNESLDLKGIVH